MSALGPGGHPGLRFGEATHTAPALLVRGKVQNAEGAVTVVADRLQRMDLRTAGKSRDFR